MLQSRTQMGLWEPFRGGGGDKGGPFPLTRGEGRQHQPLVELLRDPKIIHQALGFRFGRRRGVKASLELLQLKGKMVGGGGECWGCPLPKTGGVSPQSGSYLGEADADGLLEEGPEDALEAGGGGEGPIVAVVEVQARGQQVLHAEGGDGRRLPWEGGGGGSSWVARRGILGVPVPRCRALSLLSPRATPLLARPSLTGVADAVEVAQDVVVGGVGVSTHLGGEEGGVRAGGGGG